MSEDGKKIAFFVLIGVGVVLGLIGLIIGLSFADIHYYEYGFLRRKSTGNVDTGTIYAVGRHFVGPDFEFKTFRADAHFEHLNEVSVFASDRLEVIITASYEYFLRKDDLPLLHKAYDIHYRPILRTSAVDALKGASTVFSTREFILDRNRVERALFKAVRERLGGKCCPPDCVSKDQPDDDVVQKEGSCWPGCTPFKKCPAEDKGLFAEVRYFQLGQFSVPSDVEGRFLKALLLKEETETEQFLQDATVVTKQTSAQVKAIENSAEEVKQNATAQASLLLSLAKANATALVENARSDGLKNLYQKVGITSQNYKSSFNYLRTMKDLSNVHLAVDFSQLIMGPVKGGT